MSQEPRSQVPTVEVHSLTTLTLEDDPKTMFFTADLGRKFIQEMIKLSDRNGKRICPVSYERGTWLQLTSGQQEKCLSIWSNLAENTRNDILAIVNNWRNVSEVAAAIVNPNTNKGDLARLLHLLKDPSLTSIWSNAQTVMDRSTLDDKQGRTDYWGVLADHFNNYEGNVYENVASLLEDGAQVANPAMISAWPTVKGINPQQLLRPPRDGAWIKEQLGKIKPKFTKCTDNYHKSGNQDAEDQYLEFGNFCQGDEVSLYAFCLFSGELFPIVSQLGKLLPVAAQGDSGVGAIGERRNPTSQQVSEQDSKKSKKKHEFHINLTNDSEKTLGSNMAALITSKKEEEERKSIMEERQFYLNANISILNTFQSGYIPDDMRENALKHLRSVQTAGERFTTTTTTSSSRSTSAPRSSARTLFTTPDV